MFLVQAAVRLYTMFRKDWEAERMARQTKNKNSKKKAAKAKTEAPKLEPSRLVVENQFCNTLPSPVETKRPPRIYNFNAVKL